MLEDTTAVGPDQFWHRRLTEMFHKIPTHIILKVVSNPSRVVLSHVSDIKAIHAISQKCIVDHIRRASLVLAFNRKGTSLLD